MPLNRNRFCFFMLLVSLISYFWLALIGQLKPDEIGTKFDLCPIHRFVHIPCPSCGSTRSVLSLMHGDLAGGLYWNPLGFFIFAVLVVAPFWLAYDLILKKSTLFQFYQLCENTLRRRWVAIVAIIVILVNWVWNIYKNN
jgi:hypothetical protein